MALVVEDGTGKSDAESYVSVADADSYHTNHGNPNAWSGAVTGVKEAALRAATQYMDGTYRNRWPGYKNTQAQALAWPRGDAADADGWAIDSDVVPQAVKDACAELALRAVSAELRPDRTRGEDIKRKRQKVGPLEVETEYADGAPTQTQYDEVELILSAVIGSGSSRTVVRA